MTRNISNGFAQNKVWISGLLIFGCLFGVTASSDCPEKCSCYENSVFCKELKGTMVIPWSYVNISIMNSVLDHLNDTSFGRDIEHLTFYESKIGSIEEGTFSNLNQVRSVQFISSDIEAFKPFSVGSMRYNSELLFETVNIGEIQEQSFRDLLGLKRLSFSGCAIDTIKSYAFENIDTKELTFSDVDIKEIQGWAFSDRVKVGNLNLTITAIDQVRSHAFGGIWKLQSASISKCKFKNLQCNTLTHIVDVSPTTQGAFSIQNSVFPCGCSTWIFIERLLAQNGNVPKSVQCFEVNSAKSEHKFSSITDFCGQGENAFCEKCGVAIPSCIKITTTSDGITNQTLSIRKSTVPKDTTTKPSQTTVKSISGISTIHQSMLTNYKWRNVFVDRIILYSFVIFFKSCFN